MGHPRCHPRRQISIRVRTTARGKPESGSSFPWILHCYLFVFIQLYFYLIFWGIFFFFFFLPFSLASVLSFYGTNRKYYFWQDRIFCPVDWWVNFYWAQHATSRTKTPRQNSSSRNLCSNEKYDRQHMQSSSQFLSFMNIPSYFSLLR